MQVFSLWSYSLSSELRHTIFLHNCTTEAEGLFSFLFQISFTHFDRLTQSPLNLIKNKANNIFTFSSCIFYRQQRNFSCFTLNRAQQQGRNAEECKQMGSESYGRGKKKIYLTISSVKPWVADFCSEI